MQDDFCLWLNHIDSACSPFRFNQFSFEIFSDSSLTGWGAFCNNKEASGYWKNDESCSHINELELKAVFLALKVFAKDLYNVSRHFIENRQYNGYLLHPPYGKRAVPTFKQCIQRNLAMVCVPKDIYFCILHKYQR